jgi:putative selenate reductase FAD-binding subunit
MITQYYRPNNLQEAIALIEQPGTLPLGGGTHMSQKQRDDFSVVDLQLLGLDTLQSSGGNLEIGATVTLEALLKYTLTPKAVCTAIKLEAPVNLRNMGTIAGTLVTCDGRSPFGTVMLALDATCTLINNDPSSPHLGNILPVRDDLLRGKLIIKFVIPLDAKLAFQSVARTPSDKPIIMAAMVRWPSGRTRMALGGWGQLPTLALDGNASDPVDVAARSACKNANDERASSEYRSDAASILSKRCLDSLT